MKQYVVTKEHGIVDTDVAKHPHVECFFIKDNVLWEEFVEGDEYPYSEVMATFDTLEDAYDYIRPENPELTWKKVSGMFECFHCGERAVIWDCDYDFEDVGLQGDGIVHTCHCTNCGAEIEYVIKDR